MLDFFSIRLKGYHQVQVPQWYLVNLELFKKYDSLFKEQGRICAAGIQRIFIDFKGNVFPCMFLPQFNLGNILKDIRKVKKNLLEFNEKINQVEPNGFCKNCDAWTLCHGGCVASYIKQKSKMGETCPIQLNLNNPKTL